MIVIATLVLFVILIQKYLETDVYTVHMFYLHCWLLIFSAALRKKKIIKNFETNILAPHHTDFLKSINPKIIFNELLFREKGYILFLIDKCYSL